MPFNRFFSSDTMTSDPDGGASISYLTIGPIVLGLRGPKPEPLAPAELTEADLAFMELARNSVAPAYPATREGRRVTIGKLKTVWVITEDFGDTVTLTGATTNGTSSARERKSVAISTLIDADTKLPIK
jgi:hypothetical protein